MQEIENLQERCRALECKTANAREQLAFERVKWPSAYLQAIRDRRNAYCQGCHLQSFLVHLTQCFHLLCETCYREDQRPAPEAPFPPEFGCARPVAPLNPCTVYKHAAEWNGVPGVSRSRGSGQSGQSGHGPVIIGHKCSKKS